MANSEGTSTVRWMPVGIVPTEPILVVTLPRGQGWIHEIKPSRGLRIIARIRDGEVRLAEDGRREYAPSNWPITEALALLPCREEIIDGELAPDERSGVLPRGLKDRGDWPYFAFDLLWLDGVDLRQAPLVERKARLATLLRKARRRLVFVEHAEAEQGEALYQSAMEAGAYGILSKRADAMYIEGLSQDWRLLITGTMHTPSEPPRP